MPSARRSSTASLVAAAALATVVLGCASDDVTAPALPTCADGTQITELPTATGGRVSWSPACLVSFVAVVDSAESVGVWAIRTSTPALSSPQQAFVTPPGAYDLASRRLLQVGTPYFVVLGVRYVDPETGVIGERAVAVRPFTPSR
jgi:hypothetical protein